MSKTNLNEREAKILRLLDIREARSVDQLIERSKLKPQEVLATCLVLEVRRLIKQLPGKRYLRDGPQSVADAMRALKQHDQMVQDFYADPMTKAMGVPTDDFQADFDVKERRILAYIVDHASAKSRARKLALWRMEKWMP